MRRVEAALTAAGHTVWTDSQLPAHRAYADVIEERLGAAEAVLVLWSTAAARSQWVRAEAEFAREAGKLVQASLDDSLPPMPFNQIQCPSLRGWRGSPDAAGWKTVLASIEALGAARTEAPSPAPPRKGVLAHWRPLAAAGAALALASVLGAVWLLRPAAHWSVESSRPFIATLALEGEPAFSPDGKSMAYTSGPDPAARQIYVRSVAGSAPIRITSDGRLNVSPVWSPDGTRIAYVAVKAGEPCRIMIASVPAGESRQVARCTYAETTSLAWRTGAPELYYSDHPATPNEPDKPGSGGPKVMRLMWDQVARLNLDTGTKDVLPREEGNTLIHVLRLECSPDGRWLLLVGSESASTNAVRLRDLKTGRERTLTKIVVGGSATWSEDSRTVLVANASGIGSRITAHPIDGSAAYPVYAAAVNVAHLAAGKGGNLALETDPQRQNLARPRPQPSSEPDIIDPANGRTWSPTFAPDGTLAFLSNRSGSNAIWLKKPGAAPTLLYDGGLKSLFRLSFSPDGKYLAAPVAEENGLTINVLTVEGVPVASFHSPTLGSGAPTWTPDSKAVVYFDKSMLGYIRVDVADPKQRQLISPKLWASVFMYGGRLYGQRFARPGLWQIDGGPRLVSPRYPEDWGPPPALTGSDILVPDFGTASAARILSQPLTGGPERFVGYAPGAEAENNLQSGMAVNPRTGDILYVASVQSDSNIDLLSLAHR